MNKKELRRAEVVTALTKAMYETSIDLEDFDKVINDTVGHLFPKTLADYPSGWKEGQRCSLDGMWADVWFPRHQEWRLRILSAANWDPSETNTALVYWPGNDRNAAEDEVPIEWVIPRFDLQRAWTAEGKPVGEVEQ